MTDDNGISSGRVGAVLVVWFAVAVGIGASGLIGSLRPPAPQLVLIGLTIGSLVATFGMPSLRRWAFEEDERRLVAFHLSRFVGIYFLVLYARGELPFQFAVVGGWGDIAVATTALPLVALARPRGPRMRLAYLGWNVLGLADILMVVVTAARLSLANPASMRPLVLFPLNLLLTFVVPLIITTHVVLLIRLWRTPRGEHT